MGLVKLDPAVVGLAEDAVEHDEVVVRVVGDVGGDLAHAPGVAGSASRGRSPHSGPGRSHGQNAALQVTPEVALDPLRQSAAHGVGLGCPGSAMALARIDLRGAAIAEADTRTRRTTYFRLRR